MSLLMKGAPAAQALDQETILKIEELKQKGVCPTLAILRVGKRPDDLAYERAAEKRCDKLGIEVQKTELDENVSQEELISEIERLNRDDRIHGVLMFRPLPGHLDEEAACTVLLPSKDVDGVGKISMVGVYAGEGEGFAPCTAQSVMTLLRYYGIDPAGKKVAVVGRSLVIGKPVSMLLNTANATVTMCHSRTKDMAEVTRNSDIVVAAIGKPEYLGKEYFGEDQIVVDVGINWSESKQKIVGDVDFENVNELVGAITPVPAGVGSVTTAVLASHVVRAAEKQTEKN